MPSILRKVKKVLVAREQSWMDKFVQKASRMQQIAYNFLTISGSSTMDSGSKMYL